MGDQDFDFGFGKAQDQTAAQPAAPAQAAAPAQPAQDSSGGFDFGFGKQNPTHTFAEGSYQTKPGGPIEVAQPGQTPEPENKLFKKHPANVLYRDIRSQESPEQIAARQKTAGDVSERIMSPVRTDDLMTPEQQKNHPIVAGGLDIATSMITPENFAIMAATGGLGTFEGPLAKTGAEIVSRAISMGYSWKQVADAAKETPEIMEAFKRGDESAALRGITHVVGNVAMAALGTQHAAGVEATPETTWGRRAQAPVDQGVTRVAQAFRSDARAMGVATATRDSAKAILEQRDIEQQNHSRQAIEATKDAQQAQVDYEAGKITKEQLDQQKSRASAAAANARKATQALSDAHEQHNAAEAEVDRMQRRLDRTKVVTGINRAKDAESVRASMQKAFPNASRGPARAADTDWDIADAYLEHEHANVQAIDSPKAMSDALQHSINDLNEQVKTQIQKYGQDEITENVPMYVRDKLAGSPRADYVERGMAALENYNLTAPTLEEADRIRDQMGAEANGHKPVIGFELHDLLERDPEFAALFYAQEALREGIYGRLEENNVTGAREARKDMASLIKVKNVVERQADRGDVKLRGSGESAWYKKAAATALPPAGAAIGAKYGGWMGAAAGEEAGSRLGKRIFSGDKTRNDIIGDRFKKTVADAGRMHVIGQATPAGPYPMPSYVSPAMQMMVPQRENTPLHAALASHYGEDIDGSSYWDLEQRLKDDIQAKTRNNVPLESGEKNLWTKIVEQNAADKLAAQQQMQEMAARGESAQPEVNLPWGVDPLLEAPTGKMVPGMDTKNGIMHEIAHAVVLNDRGLTTPDGIRSHLHPENVKAGSLMSVPIDWSPFLDKDGEVDPNKIKSKAADIAAGYVAGGVANDLYHDIPFTENHNLGADVSELKKFLKSLGFNEAQTSKMIAQAAEDAAQILSQPGVQDVIERHAAVREHGTNERYHVEPERMDQILEDVDNARQDTARKPAKPAGTGNGAGKKAGAGKEAGPDEGRPAELRKEEPRSPNGKGGPAKENAVDVPASPKLDTGVEDEDKLVVKEIQSPLRENYPIRVVDKEGTAETANIPAYSFQDALEQAEKRYPGYRAIEAHTAPTPIERSTEYSVPTQKRLSMHPESGRPPEHIEIHELGHAMVGQQSGVDTNGIIRHTHPDTGGDANAAALFDISKHIDPETGRIKPESVPAIIRTLMGGIAADELFNDIPRAANNNFVKLGSTGGDGNQSLKILMASGMSSGEALKTMHAAIDTAKQYLNRPEVSGIIKENVGNREPGLSRQYHYSPERLKSMHEETQRRIQNGTTNSGPTGAEGAEGRAADVAGGEGTAPQSARGTLQAAELTPQQTVEDEGLKYKGELVPGSGVHMFEHPAQPGQTAALKAPFTGEDVRQKMASKIGEFAANAAAKSAKETGGFTYNPKTGKTPTDGYMVETFPERQQILDHTPTAADIQQFADKNKDILDQHPELHVGGYGNELGISGRYTDRDAAINAAKKLDQISIWDNAAKQEIKTGGSGKTTQFPGYTPEQRIADMSGDNLHVAPEPPYLPGSPKLSPRGSTVPLMEKPLKVEPSGETDKPSTLDVAQALNERTKNKIGALELGKATPKQQQARAMKLAEDEARYQLAQKNSGTAWYTDDVKVHDSVLQRMRPELKDPAKLSMFKWVEAVLSSGQKPYSNMKTAIKAWDQYHETGEFPAMNPDTGKSWGPRGVNAYGNAIGMINQLIQEKGEAGASEWLLSEHPVSELRKYNDSVSGKMSDQRLGAMILGEKRGPFGQNLHGIESAFTADMWVSRTWNRWMGTMDFDPETGEITTDAPRNKTERDLMTKSFAETAKKLGLTTSSLQAVLWYYEQGLYTAHGAAKESWSFSDAANRLEKEMGPSAEQEQFPFGANKRAAAPKPQIPEKGPVSAADFLGALR